MEVLFESRGNISVKFCIHLVYRDILRSRYEQANGRLQVLTMNLMSSLEKLETVRKMVTAERYRIPFDTFNASKATQMAHS